MHSQTLIIFIQKKSLKRNLELKTMGCPVDWEHFPNFHLTNYGSSPLCASLSPCVCKFSFSGCMHSYASLFHIFLNQSLCTPKPSSYLYKKNLLSEIWNWKQWVAQLIENTSPIFTLLTMGRLLSVRVFLPACASSLSGRVSRKSQPKQFTFLHESTGMGFHSKTINFIELYRKVKHM